MEDGNGQSYTEDRIKASGTQPGLGLRTSNKRACVRPTISGVRQAVSPDPPEMGSGKQPTSTPGGPEKEPGHAVASEEQPSELRTQDPRTQARPGKKQSSQSPLEGPGELKEGQDQSKPGSKLELQPHPIPVVTAGLQQPGSGEKPGRQQRMQSNLEPSEGQPPESCQLDLREHEDTATLEEKTDNFQPSNPGPKTPEGG
ncbi:PREDICTED: spermatogenesis-associated protein 21-like [Elephantulus edwardii]|uniref:spermatogenesis-associated protein 21-like n=1 Tax=Elephantulus edwardii TaxID=28737 RepID=UPI0003F0BBBD|nr:PREDICTED: spermatogenesis-associated protein 21-like [Elephantulus edwardii]